MEVQLSTLIAAFQAALAAPRKGSVIDLKVNLPAKTDVIASVTNNASAHKPAVSRTVGELLAQWVEERNSSMLGQAMKAIAAQIARQAEGEGVSNGAIKRAAQGAVWWATATCPGREGNIPLSLIAAAGDSLAGKWAQDELRLVRAYESYKGAVSTASLLSGEGAPGPVIREFERRLGFLVVETRDRAESRKVGKAHAREVAKAKAEVIAQAKARAKAKGRAKAQPAPRAPTKGVDLRKRIAALRGPETGRESGFVPMDRPAVPAKAKVEAKVAEQIALAAKAKAEAQVQAARRSVEDRKIQDARAELARAGRSLVEARLRKNPRRASQAENEVQRYKRDLDRLLGIIPEAEDSDAPETEDESSEVQAARHNLALCETASNVRGAAHWRAKLAALLS